MIKLINEELNIYSCGIADLTAGQAAAFLKQWGPGATIGSLTVFYDSEGKIVLNADNKKFEKCKEIIIEYLQLSEDRKIDLKETTITETFKSIFVTLDAALQYRKKKVTKDKINEILPILNLIHVDWDTFEEISAIYSKYSRDDLKIFGAIDAYNYGMIQGKRAERAKKKHKSEAAV